MKLPQDMDTELIKLFYYDQVKALSQLRETMFHYELADEGSDGKSLATLTGVVEKILDRKLRETNRRAQERAGAVPGMTADVRPKRRARKERRKRNALLADNLSDTSSDTSSTSSRKTKSSSNGSVVACPAVHDECREKGLCYQFQRGACTKGDKCKYKHEKCSAPLPPGFVKKRKGKGKGKGKGTPPGSQPGSPRSRSSSPDPRTAEQKAKVLCRHHKRGLCRLGDKCPYKH